MCFISDCIIFTIHISLPASIFICFIYCSRLIKAKRGKHHVFHKSDCIIANVLRQRQKLNSVHTKRPNVSQCIEWILRSHAFLYVRRESMHKIQGRTQVGPLRAPWSFSFFFTYYYIYIYNFCSCPPSKTLGFF